MRAGSQNSASSASVRSSRAARVEQGRQGHAPQVHAQKARQAVARDAEPGLLRCDQLKHEHPVKLPGQRPRIDLGSQRHQPPLGQSQPVVLDLA